jgi:hypothetical protein
MRRAALLAVPCLLASAGHGQAQVRAKLSMFLSVEAADGYRAVFALLELDPAFTDAVVLVADRRDGLPLAAGEGPVRLVVAHEKPQARWARQVRALRVLQANP